jgi:hypothetical protein
MATTIVVYFFICYEVGAVMWSPSWGRTSASCVSSLSGAFLVRAAITHLCASGRVAEMRSAAALSRRAPALDTFPTPSHGPPRAPSRDPSEGRELVELVLRPKCFWKSEAKRRLRRWRWDSSAPSGASLGLPASCKSA